MKAIEQGLPVLPVEPNLPTRCSSDCGGCQWQEMLRERITDRHVAVRFRCLACLVEHTRLLALISQEPALSAR